MEYRLVLCLHLLSFVPHSANKCTSANYCEVLIWGPWSACSTGCGRGLRHRLPGLCCPAGVTAQTIFAECAVKLCNMTESDYNQTGDCSSTLGCTSATPETTQTTLPIAAVSSKMTTTTTTLGTASPEVTTKPTLPASVIPEITTKWTLFGGSPEVKTIVPPPFGFVTLMTLTAALLAAIASCVVCAVFAVKRRQDKKRRNSVLPYNS